MPRWSFDRLTEGVDVVCHQAALRITHCAEEPVRAVQIMRRHENILESAVRHGVKKFIAASSASVYGEPSYVPMDEGHPFNNRTLYGAPKSPTSRCCAPTRTCTTAVRRPCAVQRLRPAHGRRRRLHRGHDPLAGPPGRAGTDHLRRWSQTMDFVYVEDVADAYVLAAAPT